MDFAKNSKNVYSTLRKFNLDRKHIREWLKQEKGLVNQKRGSRSNGRGCIRGFHRWNRHGLMIVKRHGMKGK